MLTRPTPEFGQPGWLIDMCGDGAKTDLATMDAAQAAHAIATRMRTAEVEKQVTMQVAESLAAAFQNLVTTEIAESIAATIVDASLAKSSTTRKRRRSETFEDNEQDMRCLRCM